MRVLLVYPRMPDTFYAMTHFIRVVGKKATYPPLGLLTIASLLPADWEKKLVDSNVAPLRDEDLEGVDLVLLSAMNVQEDSVREIVAQCNRAGVRIAAGGPLFTHEHDRFPGIDHFILNEAELTLPEFLEDWKAGKAKPIYATPEFADVTRSPLPAYGLVDLNQYVYSIVQYSRGCPYMCDFCDVTALFGRKPRTKTSDQMIRELDALCAKGGIRLVLFADDNLIGNKRLLKTDLLPRLIAWRKEKRPSVFFATQLTINLADDEELMDLLLEAGFQHIFIGIETPDEEALKVSHKNQNLKRDPMESIRRIHAKGFIISAGFIVGFDTDTPAIFARQAGFIQASGIPLPILNILKAPPGTALFEKLKTENRLSRRFAFSEGETNVVPAMDEKILYQGFIETMTRIYLPEHSCERILRFLEGHVDPRTSTPIPERIGMQDLLILARIVYLLGFRDPDRRYFWKLIGWSLARGGRFLDKAILYGIMLYQMHQTYRHIKATVEGNLRRLEREPRASLSAA